MIVSLIDAFVATVLLIWARSLRKKTLHPLPPGPTPIPFIGNITEFSRTSDHVHWAKHKDVYGPISSVTLLGQKLVIINDRSIAMDLLDKRSHIYSDRPHFVFGNMCGLGRNMAFIHNDDFFKAQRKVLHQAIGTKSSVSLFWPTLEVEALKLLGRMLKEPDQFASHVRLFTVSGALGFIYGYTALKTGSDPNVAMAELAVEVTGKSFQTGAWLVDIIPPLQYLPKWLPGMGFKRLAETWREDIERFADRPVAFTKYKMANGTASPSIVSRALLADPSSGNEFATKWAAETSYGASTDTTKTALNAFAIAMLLYPDVQRKAQSEIEKVVGPDRLPTFADRDKLPYVNALLKEVYRWHTAIPLAIAHASCEDDVYNGYFIPKGSLLVPNVWLFNHDSATHPDPYNFKPERYLPAVGKNVELGPEPDSLETSFGFGRRICPGRLLVDANVYIVVVTSLAIFNISRACDSEGREISPKYETEDMGGLSHIKPFPSNWKVRSPKALQVLTRVLEELPEETPDHEILALLDG